MTLLRIWPSTNGPAATTADTDNYSMGTEFYVTSPATATAVYLWRPATAPATTFDVGIYQVTGTGSTGTLVGSVTGNSVAANYNGWYRVQFPTPINLLAGGVSYIAVVASSTDNWYSATASYWSSGAGSAGLANGILHAPHHGDTAGPGQGRFAFSGTLAYPTLGSSGGNYWVDVEVDDGVSSAVEVTAPLTASASPSMAVVPVGIVTAPLVATAVVTADVVPVAMVEAGFAAAATLTAAVQAVGGIPEVSAGFTAAGTLAAEVVEVGVVGAGFTATASPSAVAAAAVDVTAVFTSTAALSAVAGSSELLSVAQENALTTGTEGPAFWMDYPGEEILGFARSSYYTPGETAEFSVDYSTAYNVQIWRLGWYAEEGARKVADFAGTTTTQPAAATIPNSNGAKTCSAWSRNVTWDIPTDATPGWYWAFLRDTSGDNYGGILFCVSDKLVKRPILVVSSEATWGAAYSGYGGNNVYGASLGIGTITARALCSTYDKPIVTRDNVPQTFFFNGELAQLRFLERFGFEVGYTTCEQIHHDPTIMDGRDLIVFSGHNEYISQVIRDKTEAVIGAGTNVANFSANDFFWRTAYGDETGFPTGNTATAEGRVMWCRKDTMPGPSTHTAGTPFTTAADWTGTWQDTRWTGRKPSSLLLGDQFIANGIRADEVKVPYVMKSAPIWRNCTDIAALTTGQSFSFGAGTAGMEWDMPADDLPSVSLSASSVNLTDSASDADGQDYDEDGTYVHAFQMVRNGDAHIFNANTTQWGWALDDLHDRGSDIATVEARQATLNVLYDLGATAVGSLVTAASLTVPTPVDDIDEEYGLPAEPEVIERDATFAAGAVLSAATVEVEQLAAAYDATATLSVDVVEVGVVTAEFVTSAVLAVTVSPVVSMGADFPAAATLAADAEGFLPGEVDALFASTAALTAETVAVLAVSADFTATAVLRCVLLEPDIAARPRAEIRPNLARAELHPNRATAQIGDPT